MIKDQYIRQRLDVLLEAAYTLAGRIMLLQKQNNISKDDIINLYGYTECISSEQHILEREVLR